MRKILALLSLVMAVVLLSSCGAQSGGPGGDGDGNPSVATVRLGGLTGPTTMGMAKLLSDNDTGETENQYEFTLAGVADELTAEIAAGRLDIVAVPCNLAAVLYNNESVDVTLLAVNTLSVLYIVETGSEISSVEDLRGKTVYSTGKGTTPEMTLNYLLAKNGLEVGTDVTIDYKSEAAEIAALLAESDGIAMLPQPYVTVAMNGNENLRVALDVGAEWDKVSEGESSVVTGVVICRTAFLEENKDAVDIFLAEYKASIDYVNANIEEAALLIGEIGIVPAAVAKSALPYCGITYVDGDEMKALVSGYLGVLFDQNEKSVGGKLPDDAFYYKK